MKQHDWSFKNENGVMDEYYVVVGYNTGSSGKWMQGNGKWWYRNGDGTWPVSAWKQIDGRKMPSDPTDKRTRDMV